MEGILKIENGVVKGLNDKEYKGEVEIPGSYEHIPVTAIGAEAFANCGEITKVVLSEELVSIGKFAFFNCKKLKTVVFGYRVSKIERSAFQNCEALEAVELQYGIAEIEPWTFAGCKALKRVVIPNGVKHIGHQAFADCSSLSGLDLRSIDLYKDTSDKPALGYDVFQNVSPKCKITVPLYFEGKYKEAGQWNVFDDIRVNDDKVLYYNGLKYCEAKEAEVDEKSKRVVVTENQSFVGQANIKSEIEFKDADLPSLVVCGIDDEAFKGNSRLTSVIIPHTLETIGESAFANCSKLEYFNSDNVTDSRFETINGVLFEKAEKYTLVAYPAGHDREAYSIPATVKIIKDYAFSSIHSLLGITFPNKEYEMNAALAFDQANLSSCCAFVLDDANELKKTLAKLGFKEINSKGFVADGLNYMILDNEKHTAEVSNNVNFVGELKIPEKVKFAGSDYQVVGIGNEAFLGNNKITSVSMPDTITEIKSQAFENTSVSRIAIPPHVVKIGLQAFNSMKNVKNELEVPASVNEIGSNAFSNSSFTLKVNNGNKNYCSEDNILFNKAKTQLIYYMACKPLCDEYKVPDKITELDGRSFAEAKIRHLRLPASLAVIKSAAFYGNKTIEKITIDAKEPPELEGYSFFTGTSSNLFVFVPKGCAKTYQEAPGWKDIASHIIDEIPSTFSVGNINYKVLSEEDRTVEVIKSPDVSGTLTIPEEVPHCGVPFKVTRIGVEAFRENGKITDITLPDTIKYIGNRAFYYVSSKKSITVPKSLEEIGICALMSPGLTFVNLDLPSGLKKINALAFDDVTVLTKKVTIPASVSSLGDDGGMFRCGIERFEVASGNTNYKSVEGVLFSKNGEILVEYPDANTRKSYTVPSGVKTIYSRAFLGCKNLEEIILPDTINSIGSYEFRNATSLNLLDIKATTPPKLYADALYGFNSHCIVRVPEGCATNYKTAEVWKTIASRIIDKINPEFSVGNINYKVLSLIDRTVEVAKNPNASGAITIPSNVSYLGFQFAVVGIGAEAFHDSKITSISLPNTIKSVGRYAFCELSISMSLPSSLEKVGYYAFENNIFEDLNLPSGLKEIGGAAFTFTKVKSERVTIPSSVTSIIAGNVFYAAGIKEIKVSDNNPAYKSINGVLFSKDGRKLISYPIRKPDAVYSIPYGVTTIEWTQCANSMTRLVVPASVNKLDDGALWAFPSLKTLELQCTTPPVVGSNSSLTAVRGDRVIIVPKGCAAKYKAAEGWKDFASHIVEESSQPEFTFNNIKYKVLSFVDRTVEVAKNPNASGAITIPSNVSYLELKFTVVGIGTEAFYNSKITSVSLPNTIKSVGYYAFYGLNISMSLPSSLEKVGMRAFRDNTFEDLSLPSGLKEIGRLAFEFATVKSQRATIPSSVTAIAGNVFYVSVKEIKVSDSNPAYKSINGVLFSKDGRKLTAYPYVKPDTVYSIPSGVTTIESDQIIASLTRLVIPASVNKLEACALWSLYNLKTLELQGTTPPVVGDQSLHGVKSSCVIIVPKGCAAKYKAASGWKNFASQIREA